MTVQAVEKMFKRFDTEYDLHYSGISKSVYFRFRDKKDDERVLRISNHDLPASYQMDRTHYSDLDYRFTELISDLKLDIARLTGKTEKRIPVKKTPEWTAEEIAFIKSEYESLGCEYKRVRAFYRLKLTEKQFLKRIGVIK
jgi:hypothetical protein